MMMVTIIVENTYALQNRYCYNSRNKLNVTCGCVFFFFFFLMMLLLLGILPYDFCCCYWWWWWRNNSTSFCFLFHVVAATIAATHYHYPRLFCLFHDCNVGIDTGCVPYWYHTCSSGTMMWWRRLVTMIRLCMAEFTWRSTMIHVSSCCCCCCCRWWQ